MRAQAETPLDQLVPAAVKKVSRKGPYFTKSEVVAHRADQAPVSKLLTDVRRRPG